MERFRDCEVNLESAKGEFVIQLQPDPLSGRDLIYIGEKGADKATILAKLSLFGQLNTPSVMRSHQEVLSVLSGLRLRRIFRTLDAFYAYFGDMREVPSRRGGTKKVGEWVLDIQTSWRFTRRDRILLGVLDLYAYAEDGTEYDWDSGGESRFDRIASSLNETFRDEDVRVRHVACDQVGSILLQLDTDLEFAVFPNFSSDYPDREYWRLFKPSTDYPHYVVSTKTPLLT